MVPEQIVVEPAMLAVGKSRTVIVVVLELISAQLPFLVTALNSVVVVMLLYDKVVAVFDIPVQVEPALVEDSQRTTEPLWLATVKVPEFDPLQTVAAAVTVPAAEAASTVILAVWPLGDVLQFGLNPVVAIVLNVTAVVPAVLKAGVVVDTVKVPDPVAEYVRPVVAPTL